MEVSEWQCQCGETFYTEKDKAAPTNCAYCKAEAIKEV